MKTLFAVPFCCLLLARSSFAIPTFDHVEVEEKLQQRQRDLKGDKPLNEDEIYLLKRMISRRTLRFNDDASNNYHGEHNRRKLVNDKYADDSLAKAMIESAFAKVETIRRAGRRELRGSEDKKELKTLDNDPDGSKKSNVKKDDKKDAREIKKKNESKKGTTKNSHVEKKGTKRLPGDEKTGVFTPRKTPPNHSREEFPNTDGTIQGRMEGRMDDGNESSEIYTVSTTRDGGYRNEHHNNGNNRGHRNEYYNYGNDRGYYNYGNDRGHRRPPPINDQQEEENWVEQQRAEIPEKVSMVLEAFQDSRMIQEPILNGASFLSPGTQYLYSNEPLYNVVFDIPPNVENSKRGAYLVNERDKIAEVTGECIRIDPKNFYVGQAYCQFEYSFLDSHGNVEASLTASGPVAKGDIDTLAITGGSGIFRRTVGTVILESGNIRRGNPPVFIPDDNLDLPSSYLVKMFVFLDSVDLELAQRSS